MIDDRFRFDDASFTRLSLGGIALPRPNLTPWQKDSKERHWFRCHRGVTVIESVSTPDDELLKHVEMLATIKVKPVFGMHFTLSLGHKCETALGLAWVVFISVAVPHRDVEEVQRIVHLRFPIVVLCTAFLGRIRLAQVIREALIEWVIPHEVDEMIEMDGERVFDPHAPGGMDWG